MIKFLLLSTTFVSFTLTINTPAFASSKSDRKETTENILSNEMGGLVFSQGQCFYSFKNKATGETYGKNTRKAFNIIAVPPGKYGLTFIQCRYQRKSGDTVRNYNFGTKDTHLWFEEFDVEAGQVLYPGTFSGFTSKYSSPGIKINHFLKKETQEFPIFKVYSSGRVLKKTKKKFPKLVDRLTTNLMRSRLDIDVLTELIREPYKLDANGKKPALAIANKKAEFNYKNYTLTGVKPTIK